jgi:hypothetical protein
MAFSRRRENDKQIPWTTKGVEFPREDFLEAKVIANSGRGNRVYAKCYRPESVPLGGEFTNKFANEMLCLRS